MRNCLARYFKENHLELMGPSVLYNHQNALLVLSVNNEYKGLIRANIRYGKNRARAKLFNGGGSKPVCPQRSGNYEPFNSASKMLYFSIWWMYGYS